MKYNLLNRSSFKYKSFGVMMVLPGFITILLLKMYPIMEGISYAFTNKRMDRPASATKFIGLENFAEALVDHNVWDVVGYTFIYAFCIVFFSYAIGLILALLLNRKIRFRGIYRALILLPWVVSNTVAAANFRWILNDRYGIVNKVLLSLNIVEKPIQFFANIANAKAMVIGVGVWKTIPFMAIVILAALQSVPTEYYEAAEIDGASFWQRLRFITMPSIKSVTVMATMLQFIWNFNNFESIWLLTEGGPNEATHILPVQIYEMAFLKNRIGYAAAIGVLVLVFMMIFAWIRLKVTSTDD